VTTCIEEGAVVTDHQQRALELEQQVLQQVEGLGVEIVGGLVEDEQVERAG
jgi:selenophosphate synthetase-related protein